MLAGVPFANSIAIVSPDEMVSILDASHLQVTWSSPSASTSPLHGLFALGNKLVTWRSRGGMNTIDPSDSTSKFVQLDTLLALAKFGENEMVALLAKESSVDVVLFGPSSEEDPIVVASLDNKKREEKVSLVTASCVQSKCVIFNKGRSLLCLRPNPDQHDDDDEEAAPYQFFTLKLAKHATVVCLSVFHEKDTTTICAGLSNGVISLHRVCADPKQAVNSQLHWHTGFSLKTLYVLNHEYLLSGGKEGVLVLWRLDQGTQSMDFRPRIGAPILSLVPARGRNAAVAMLLENGTCVLLSLPELNVLVKRPNCWIPRTTTLCSAQFNSSLLASFDPTFHSPGVLTFYNPSTKETRELDVSQRNAVSASHEQARWKINVVQFSPNGHLLVCVLSSFEKQEVRVFVHEREICRISLLDDMDKKKKTTTTKPSCEENQTVCVTNTSVAIADRHKVVVFQLSSTGVLETQCVFDMSPQVVTRVCLSSDESCVGALCAGGQLRIWDRLSGEILHQDQIAEKVSGMAFSNFSREIYFWTDSRVTALVSTNQLNVPVSFASCVGMEEDAIAVLSLGRILIWKGRQKVMHTPLVIQEVETRLEWKSFEFSGKDGLGWILSTERGWEFRGGSSSDVDHTTEQDKGKRRLPGIRLYRPNTVKESDKVILKDHSLNRKVPLMTEWCAGMPSHLLQVPPPISMVFSNWTTTNPKSSSSMSMEPVKLVQKKKKLKSEDSVPTEEDFFVPFVEAESLQEKADFQLLFASLKN